MKETRKTLAFVGAAAFLAVLALLTTPRAPTSEAFSEQGKPFYPDFVDPLKAASLEVVEFIESTGEAKPFKVELKDGKWTIPSHHNYPADAKDRLAKTAAAVIDLRKDAIRSDRPQDHELLGVIDPLDKNAPLRGRGKRVTLRDRDGNVLADFIFGRETREGACFVRVPTRNRTYAVKRKVDISTKFEDWIETDLLQLSQYDIRKVVIDSYSIDEEQGRIKDRASYFLSREDSTGPWKISQMKETEEPNTENINAMMTALDDLKIVGVRPKPAFLGKDLKAKGEFQIKGQQVSMQQLQAIQSLKSKGFYVVPVEVLDASGRRRVESQIFSNEGEVQVYCADGIVYTLRFGEVLVGEGEEVTAGKEEEPPKEGPGKKEEKKEEKKGTENRYLMVTAAFDESLLGAPPVEPTPPPGYKPEEKKEEKKEGESKAEEKKQDPPEVEKYKKDKEEYDRKKKEFDEKIEKGKKRAQDLTDRFADWYYVISGDLFKKIRRARAELVKPKAEKKEGEEKKDEHKHEEGKPEEKKPEAPKSEEKKPPAPGAEEKKPEAPKAEGQGPGAPKTEEKKSP